MYTHGCKESHRVCYTCIQSHVILKVHENLEARCPVCNEDPGIESRIAETLLDQSRHPTSAFDDSEEYPLPETLKEMTPQAIARKYNKQELNRALDGLPGSIKCPRPNCNWVCVASEPGIKENVQCRECGFSFCSLCHAPYHYKFECGELPVLAGNWVHWNQGQREQYLARLDKETQQRVQARQQYAGARAEHEQEIEQMRQAYEQLQADEEWKSQHVS